MAAVRDHFSRFNKVWFQKHSDWQSEAEYRFVYYDPSSRENILVDLSGCVVGLVVGADFQDADLTIVDTSTTPSNSLAALPSVYGLGPIGGCRPK